MLRPHDPRPLALLIPGLDGTGRFYAAHLDGLSSRYRVIPWAFIPRARFEFPDLVEELRTAITFEPPHSVIVVGESFGGAIALHFVLACPESISRLILINSFCYYGRRARISIGCRLAPLLRWRGISRIKNFLADRMLASEGINDEGRRLYHKVVAVIDQGAYRRRLELVREVDLRARLPEVSTSTLILASGKDKIVPSIRSARFMAENMPDARVQIFPEAGHALLLTPGFDLADYL